MALPVGPEAGAVSRGCFLKAAEGRGSCRSQEHLLSRDDNNESDIEKYPTFWRVKAFFNFPLGIKICVTRRIILYIFLDFTLWDMGIDQRNKDNFKKFYKDVVNYKVQDDFFSNKNKS